MFSYLFKWLFTQKMDTCTVCQRPGVRQERYFVGTKAYPLCIDCLCQVAHFDQCLNPSLHPKKTQAKNRREAQAYLRKIEQQGNCQALALLKAIQAAYRT